MVARVLGVDAEGCLRAPAVILAGGQRRRGKRRVVDVGAVRGRAAEYQPGRCAPLDTSCDLFAPVVVTSPRIRERAVGDGGAELKCVVAHARLDSGIPSECRDHRKAGADGKRPKRVTGAPPARAHPEDVLGVRRQRVGSHRSEVLVGERVSNQRVVGAIDAPRKCAERRRNAPRLDVDRAIAPGANPHVQCVGPERIGVLGSDLGKHGQTVGETDVRREAEPQHPQRVVLVVGVVEPRAIRVILRRERHRDVGAEPHASAGDRDRAGGQLLRARRRTCGQQRQQDPSARESAPRECPAAPDHDRSII